MAKKKTEPIVEEKVDFKKFKESAEYCFACYQQSHPEACDLRIYEELPFNESRKLLPYESSSHSYWMMFSYEKYHWIVVSCDPVNDRCFYYTDFNYTDSYGEQFGYFHKFALNGSFYLTFGDISMYIQMLQNDRNTIVKQEMFVKDGNCTEAWKNGDTPLPFEYNHGSLIILIDAIIEAKKNPDPTWRGMRIEAYFDGICSMCDYAVQF